jgi:hypothetical protein
LKWLNGKDEDAFGCVDGSGSEFVYILIFDAEMQIQCLQRTFYPTSARFLRSLTAIENNQKALVWLPPLTLTTSPYYYTKRDACEL